LDPHPPQLIIISALEEEREYRSNFPSQELNPQKGFTSHISEKEKEKKLLAEHRGASKVKRRDKLKRERRCEQDERVR